MKMMNLLPRKMHILTDVQYFAFSLESRRPYLDLGLWIPSEKSSEKAHGPSPWQIIFVLKVRRNIILGFLATYTIRIGLDREACIHRGSHPPFPTVRFISFPLDCQEPSAQAVTVKFIWVQQAGQIPQTQWVFSVTYYSWALDQPNSYIFFPLTSPISFFHSESRMGSANLCTICWPIILRERSCLHTQHFVFPPLIMAPQDLLASVLPAFSQGPC